MKYGLACRLCLLRNISQTAVPPPPRSLCQARAVLEMLCCGLCGAAPAFATMSTSPSRKASSARRAAAAAAVAAAAAAAPAEGAGTAGPEQDSQADAAEPPPVAAAGSPAAEEAAAATDGGAVANGACVAAPLAGAGGEAEDAEDAPLLFRSSVTLPAAYFPPERFHAGGVSMPLDVFVGPPLPSEEQAANAAALLALTALHRLGIIVRYWPSRLLLAQHLLPRSLAAAAPPGALPGLAPPPAQDASPAAAAGISDEAAAGSAGMAGMAASAAHQGQQPGFMSSSAAQQAQQANVMNFFCPLCNVAATGHKVRPRAASPACMGRCVARWPLSAWLRFRVLWCASAGCPAMNSGHWPVCPPRRHNAALTCPPLALDPPPGCQAFDAHLRGFRHQRRIKQAQLLQQGQEVSAMLQGLLLDEAAPGSPVPTPTGAAAAAGGAAPRVAVRRPDMEELRDEEEGGEPGALECIWLSPDWALGIPLAATRLGAWDAFACHPNGVSQPGMPCSIRGL